MKKPMPIIQGLNELKNTAKFNISKIPLEIKYRTIEYLNRDEKVVVTSIPNDQDLSDGYPIIPNDYVDELVKQGFRHARFED